MAKSPFKTVLFHPFRAMLTRAAAAGHRIEPVDKDAWAKYIREHKIPIAGLMVYGQSLSESIKAVVVSGESPADDGLYFYSDDDEVSAKFEAPAGAAPPSAAAPTAAAPAEAPPADAPPAPPPAPPPAG